MTTKLRTLGAILLPVLLLDILTKRWALDALAGGRIELLNGWIPLTLAFNRGAAFGLSVGDNPRWFFIPATIVAMVVLAVFWVQCRPGERAKLVAISLILSGAIGNLVDRVRWDRGVVDFIGPINLGFMHWPIFNVADSAITCGAVLLAIVFWREEREQSRKAAAEATDGATDAADGAGAAPEADAVSEAPTGS